MRIIRTFKQTCTRVSWPKVILIFIDGLLYFHDKRRIFCFIIDFNKRGVYSPFLAFRCLRRSRRTTTSSCAMETKSSKTDCRNERYEIIVRGQ